MTAGLNLRHLDDILLLGALEGGISRALVKQRKDAIIAAEFSRVAEMIEPLPEGFAALGGVDYLINFLRDEIIAPIRRNDRDVPKGVLFVGPPGTGKTYTVAALAQEVGFNAVALRAENILGGVVGRVRAQSPELLRLRARASADAGLHRRTGSERHEPARQRLRQPGGGQPLQCNAPVHERRNVAGKVIVVGATNRADLIDPALLRPGRFDLIIPVLLPEPEARRDILLAQARLQGGVIIEPAALDLLTGQSDQYSAADLAFLIRKARKLAERQRRAGGDAGHRHPGVARLPDQNAGDSGPVYPVSHRGLQ